ncbi:MAG: lysophospholipid acyltransferase family protein, partial [Burkholderiales bacterium]
MILLFRFFSHWPLAALHALGAALGWLVWWLSPGYRREFRAN